MNEPWQATGRCVDRSEKWKYMHLLLVFVCFFVALEDKQLLICVIFVDVLAFAALESGIMFIGCFWATSFANKNKKKTKKKKRTKISKKRNTNNNDNNLLPTNVTFDLVLVCRFAASAEKGWDPALKTYGLAPVPRHPNGVAAG